ncbi:MAG: helix-turn-helix domain-containing protein [Methylobacter sp.]
MESPAIPSVHIDLSCIDTKDRYNVWKEQISVIFDSALTPEDQQKPFNARLTTYHLSSILLSSVSSVRQHFNRDLKRIAQDGLDHFLIQVYTAGSTSGQWCKHNNSTVRSGDVFLLDLSQPIQSLASDFSCLTLTVPRHLMSAKLPEPERQHGRVLPRENTLAKLLAEHLNTLYLSSPALNPAETDSAAEGVLSLVGAYFNDTRADPDCRHVQTATRESIRRYILNNLTDLNLGADSIAAHFKISRAYLYRLFETGQGIHQFIQEQRLLKAFELLTRPANKTRISQIAYDLGFNSESHFSRSFRRMFGMTPSEARQTARTGAKRQQNPMDRQPETWLLNLR